MKLKSRNKYAVIGLGTFGSTLARLLSEQNQFVIAVDKDMDKVEKIKDEVAESVSFDATDSELLHKLGIIKADVVAISVGNNFKDSEFIAFELQNSGVDQIFVTVRSEQEEKIMRKIGIPGVINPEVQAAERLAELLA